MGGWNILVCTLCVYMYACVCRHIFVSEEGCMFDFCQIVLFFVCYYLSWFKGLCHFVCDPVRLSVCVCVCYFPAQLVCEACVGRLPSPGSTPSRRSLKWQPQMLRLTARTHSAQARTLEHTHHFPLLLLFLLYLLSVFHFVSHFFLVYVKKESERERLQSVCSWRIVCDKWGNWT